jgi:hypothetical protein
MASPTAAEAAVDIPIGVPTTERMRIPGSTMAQEIVA